MSRGRYLPGTAYTELHGGSGSVPICRLVTGIRAPGGGYTPDESSASISMDHLVQYGFTTFDVGALCVDGGIAHALARGYRRLVGRASAEAAQFVATLDLQHEPLLARRAVANAVDSALQSLSVERLDLVQLRWADADGESGDGRFLDALSELDDLRREGKVRCVGLVDFPTYAMERARKQQLPFASNQVSYSLLDRRADMEMAEWCEENGVALLAYAALGGGFLSERFIGVPEPTRRAFGTQGLGRFANVISTWGGWGLFQELLFAMKQVAEKHGVSVANVALRWVLDQRAVAAVIVGTRLGMGPETDHAEDNARVFEFNLDEEDCKVIDEITARANDLYQIMGDVGTEIQDKQSQ